MGCSESKRPRWPQWKEEQVRQPCRWVGSRVLQCIQHVDQVTKPPVIPAIEAKSDALQIQGRYLVLFLGHRRNGADFIARDDVGKILVQGFDGRRGRRVL